VIFGRSDATINRHGLRMGTSELYSAVEALPEVMDSMVVDLEYLGRESYMPLFVVLREGQALDEAMRAKINGAIRTALSPRFLPNEIFQVAEIPRTLSGKKQELPIKKLLLGHPLEKVLNREAMANPAAWTGTWPSPAAPGAERHASVEADFGGRRDTLLLDG
jgi:acetoacetyl-CoA synthetase